jgi:hypothetical protein
VGGIELVGDLQGEAGVGKGGVVDPGAVVVAAAVDDLDDQLRIVGREDPEHAASEDADGGEWDGMGMSRGAAVEGRRPVELDLPAAVAGRLVDAQRRGIGGTQRYRGGGSGCPKCPGEGDQGADGQVEALRRLVHGFS